MVKLLIIFFVFVILMELIDALSANKEKKENVGKEKIASITIKRNGYIISHEDVYK